MASVSHPGKLSQRHDLKPQKPSSFCLESFQLEDTSFVIQIDDWPFPRALQQNDRGMLFLGPHFAAAAETGYAEPASPLTLP